MANNYVRHDETLMPMSMGSPARTPEYARSVWGLPSSIDEERVVALYSDEWEGGNQGQLALVSEAAKKAGFGDNPALLRQKTAEVIKAVVEEYPGSKDELLILDVGAGPGLSALAIWQELPAAFQSKARFFLLDPSKASLEAAKKVMEDNRIKYEVICNADIYAGRYVKEESVDILVGVASVHHHSSIPFSLYYRLLKPGGIIVLADWHNSIWESPFRVYQFLQAFNWPEKELGLKNWRESYPYSNVAVPEPDEPADRQANKDIINFWLGYFQIVKESTVNLGPNSIWPLEGHRPVERYIEEMREAGFAVDSSDIGKILERGIVSGNPHQLLPQSRLLMLTIGQKKKEREGGIMNANTVNDWKRKVAELGKAGVEARRQRGFDVSEAHSPAHLGGVAETTQPIGKIYGFAGRELELSFAGGWFHDAVRSDTEDPTVGDEEASAKEAYRVLLEAGLVIKEEGAAIAYAIERQGRYPEWWSDLETRERLPETLEEKLHLALFVADKMDANGVRVIARRSQFVAGNRLRAEGGDWRKFGFQFDRDEALVVAIESLLRLAFINPEGIYPLRLKPVVEPLYQVQREFVLGVLHGLHLTVEDIARLLLETKTGEGKNILQVRKISALENISGLAKLITVKSGIVDEAVARASEDIASSALETVEYFSHRYQEDLDRLALKWIPAGEKAREWRQGMIDYMEGKF